MQNEPVTTTAEIAAPQARRPLQPFAITQPIRVTSRADIASLLRAHRIAMDLTCEAFDERAGWSDRYVTKLENGDKPSCKRGFELTPPTSDNPADKRAFSGDITASFMAEVWLETAGLALVLLPEDLAKSIGAVPAPRKIVGGAT
ncbi:helix-turn-helix domain-containing protein [Brevundimonas faecalis]|uniref:helix-turn-helix domain-containing protein n=1 Tax=Brevundimonas faecalis TaxID=947378 RepID=UPI00361C9F13